MTLSHTTQAATPEVPRKLRGSVVIVDNDPELLDLVATDLRLEGWDVLATVRDGLQAVTACIEELPDFLIVDYRMPLGIDGLEVTRRVRQRAPSVRVILYTNYRASGLAEQARRLGASYLVKGELATLRASLSET